MRLKRWVRYTLLIIGLSIIGLLAFNFSLKDGKLEATKTELSSSLIVEKQIIEEISGLTIQSEYNLSKENRTSYEWPTSWNEQFNNLIENWLDEKKQAGVKNISVESKLVGSSFYQLILKAGDETIVDLLPITLSVPTGELVLLSDLFTVNEEFTQFVTQSINNKLGEKTLLETINLDSLQWTIDDQALIIFFEKEASPFEQIELSISNLRPYATSNFITKNTLLSQIVAEEIAQKEREEAERRRKEEEERKRREAEERKKQHQQRANSSIGKYVAFTFDDGPHPTVTPEILKILREYNAKATFFMLGLEARKYPHLAKQVASEGHEIANHTYSHPDLTKMNYDNVNRQFSEGRRIIEEITGVKTSLFRPPYGAINDNVITAAGNQNSPIIMWSVDSRDWESRDANAIYNVVMRNIRGGSIILMHDLYPSTAEGFRRVIDTLHKEGFQFVTVSKLLEIIGRSGVGPHRGV